jgi:hypothetical protein
MSNNAFTFQPSTRVGIKPLIGLYGESNSGKTFSALLLARGIAGPKGKVLGIDTESGRMALYSDIVPNGFLRADFEPPFSPRRYIEALDAAEAQGADVIVIDSFSHEWFGEGGVLDMAAENESRSGKAGLHCWKTPKLEHAKLVSRLLRSKTFVIVCLRAKFKSRQVKNQQGKNEVVKDDFVSPLQDEDLLFEMTAHCEMQTSKPGSIRLTKWSVPDLAECFPQDGQGLLGIENGEAIARWASGTKKAPNTVPASEPDDLLLEVKDAVDAAELTRLVEQTNRLEDADRKNRVKRAIADKARALKCKWSEREQAFTSHE